MMQTWIHYQLWRSTADQTFHSSAWHMQRWVTDALISNQLAIPVALQDYQ